MAIAWVLQVAVDTIILFIMVNRLLFIETHYALRTLLTVGIVLFSLALGVIQKIVIKWLFLQLMLFTFLVIAWFVIPTTPESV